MKKPLKQWKAAFIDWDYILPVNNNCYAKQKYGFHFDSIKKMRLHPWKENFPERNRILSRERISSSDGRHWKSWESLDKKIRENSENLQSRRKPIMIYFIMYWEGRRLSSHSVPPFLLRKPSNGWSIHHSEHYTFRICEWMSFVVIARSIRIKDYFLQGFDVAGGFWRCFLLNFRR